MNLRDLEEELRLAQIQKMNQDAINANASQNRTQTFLLIGGALALLYFLSRK